MLGTGLPVPKDGAPVEWNVVVRRRGPHLGVGVALGLLALSVVTGALAGSARESHVAGPTQPAVGYVTDGGLTSPATLSTVSPTALQLSIASAPVQICALGMSSCSAGTGVARVTLTATAPPQPASWPDVQIAFVLETTAYDGIFPGSLGDGTYGLDPCGATGGPLCEESNGIPFFIANAQAIAYGIQAANPHSHVSFALVDYYDAWGSAWDDQDGPEYNVDIGQFVPPAEFGADVVNTFQANNLAGQWYNWDQDLDNNFLHSSTITALYGAIIGSDLDWRANTHHVIVWLGSTAPRDPSYAQNYCVSPSSWNVWGQPPNCYNEVCEPSYTFAQGTSPSCEGWIRSQDGNQTHSIAALARTSPTCTDSVGGVCTIDAIDYWTTPTDPYSQGWPTQFANIGGGPGGRLVDENTQRVLEAGCDIAAATGGTWDGPTYFTCPNGQAGSLTYVPHGPINQPDTNNPTLLEAITTIGFGPTATQQVAAGSHQPLFTFVPFGSIRVSANPEWRTACLTPSGPRPDCPVVPVHTTVDGYDVYSWNWSSNATRNVLYVGDVWTASFNVEATGPPYALVPVDACTTISCRAGGSGAEAGLFTNAVYVPASNETVVTESFPLAQELVIYALPAGPPASVPPPAPPAPPPFAIPIAPLTPVLQSIGIGNPVGLANISLQATAAGFLAAGFLRVGMKNRPIALRVAAKAGPLVSKFDKESAAHAATTAIGRFE
jgi:hypothetical protein